MGALIGLVIGIVIGTLLFGTVIWVVGKLGLGMDVRNFGSALLAALVISVVAGIFNWVLAMLSISIGGGLGGALVHLIIATLVLMVGSNITPGVSVRGFWGALVAALAIAIIQWLMMLALGGVLPGVPT